MTIPNTNDDRSVQMGEYLKAYEPKAREQYWQNYSQNKIGWARQQANDKLERWLLEEVQRSFEASEQEVHDYLPGELITIMLDDSPRDKINWINQIIFTNLGDPEKVSDEDYMSWVRRVNSDADELREFPEKVQDAIERRRERYYQRIERRREMQYQRELSQETQKIGSETAKATKEAATAATWSARGAIASAFAAFLSLLLQGCN